MLHCTNRAERSSCFRLLTVKDKDMSFARRLRDAFRAPTATERALAYLNESTSIADLERREREIDAGRFHHKRHTF